MSSVRSDILARYSKFAKSLKQSPSMEVAVMFGVVADDAQSTTGHNLDLTRWETGLDPVCCGHGKLKEALDRNKADVPEEDAWRIPYIGKLLEARGEAYYLGDDLSRLTALVDSLCYS